MQDDSANLGKKWLDPKWQYQPAHRHATSLGFAKRQKERMKAAEREREARAAQRRNSVVLKAVQTEATDASVWKVAK